jgi:hypothetical protein
MIIPADCRFEKREPATFALVDESKAVHGTVGTVLSLHTSEKDAKRARMGHKPGRLSVFKLRKGIKVTEGLHLILSVHCEPSPYRPLG